MKNIIWLLCFYSSMSLAATCDFFGNIRFVYKNFDLKWDTENIYLARMNVGGVDYTVSIPILRRDFAEGVTGETIVQGIKLQAFPKDAQRVFIGQLKFLASLHQKRAEQMSAQLPKDFSVDSPYYKQFALDTQAVQYYTELREVLEGNFDLNLYMKVKKRSVTN